jgi:trigger factor
MEVQVEELSSVQKKVSFVVEGERVTRSLDEAYRKLGREVKIKGFRPGKVPRRILEQRFARQIEGEVGGQLISEAFEEAVKEHNLTPVSQPIIERSTLKTGEDYSFSVTIEVQPKIELQQWEGIDVEWERVEIDETQVDEELERMRTQQATLEVAPEGHEAAAGDMATVNASFSGEGLEPYSLDTLLVSVDSAMGIPVADFLAKHLLGLKLGETRNIDEVTVPAGALGEEWNEKTAALELKVTELKARTAPALDDELAMDIGFDSLDLLKADIRGKIEEHMQAHVKGHAAQSAINKLIELNPFEIPQGLVRAQAEDSLERNFRQLSRQGFDIPAVRLDELPDDRQQGLLEESTYVIRQALLLDAIAEAAEIEIDDAQIEEHIARMAAEMGQQPAAVKALLARQGGMSSMKEQLREQQTLDLLLERANIIETEPKSHDHEHDHDHGHDHEGES